jgi:hypothetical protein
MFLLFEVIGENLILEVIPESLEVLIFGVGLVFFAIGLRAILKRAAKSGEGEVIHKTK